MSRATRELDQPLDAKAGTGPDRCRQATRGPARAREQTTQRRLFDSDAHDDTLVTVASAGSASGERFGMESETRWDGGALAA